MFDLYFLIHTDVIKCPRVLNRSALNSFAHIVQSSHQVIVRSLPDCSSWTQTGPTAQFCSTDGILPFSEVSQALCISLTFLSHPEPTSAVSAIFLSSLLVIKHASGLCWSCFSFRTDIFSDIHTQICLVCFLFVVKL